MRILQTLILSTLLGLFTLAMGAGCQTKEPVSWSSTHNERHALTFIEGWKELAVDCGRIFLNYDEKNFENLGKVVYAIPYGVHRLHMDVDRIFLDMEEYPLESE